MYQPLIMQTVHKYRRRKILEGRGAPDINVRENFDHAHLEVLMAHWQEFLGCSNEETNKNER